MTQANTIKYPLLFTLCISLSAFMAGVDLMIMSVAIDPMRKALAANVVTAQWFITAFAIGCAASYIGIGRISDRIGKRHTFTIGAALFGLSSLIVGLADHAAIAIIFRFLQGASIAMVVNSATALVMEYFDTSERPKRIAFLITGTGLGFCLGPLVGGLLLHLFSWRALFFINVPFAILALLFSIFIIPRSGHRGKEPVHILSLLLLTVSIIALSTVISQGNDWGWLSMPTWISLLVCIAAFIGLILSERHSQTPLIDTKLFALTNFVAGCSSGLLLYILIIGWLLIFGLYFQDAYGLSPLKTGFAFIPFAIAFFISPPIVARLMKKYSHKSMIVVGFFLSAIALVFMTFITPSTPFAWMVLPFLVFAFGINMVNTSSLPVALQFAPSERHGVASGIGMMTRWLGGALGTAALASIFSAFAPTSPTEALHACLWGLIVIALLAGLLAAICVKRT